MKCFLNSCINFSYFIYSNAIKVRFGVDIETLQKIRNTPKEPVTVAQPLPQPVVMMQVPRPVPPPSCLPMGVAPPQMMMMAHQSPSIQGTVTPSSKSASSIGDDMNARPMSISDGGDVRPGKVFDALKASTIFQI